MGKQAPPERIRQFQQDAELLNSNGWSVTMIAAKMETNPSNLGANVNFRAATAQRKMRGKKPGSEIIDKFYQLFKEEIGRLKPAAENLTRESWPGFNKDEEQRRIRDLEEGKKFLEQQMAAIISNNTTLTNSNARLTNSNADLTESNNDLSKAYVKLALRGKGGDQGG